MVGSDKVVGTNHTDPDSRRLYELQVTCRQLRKLNFGVLFGVGGWCGWCSSNDKKKSTHINGRWITIFALVCEWMGVWTPLGGELCFTIVMNKALRISFITDMSRYSCYLWFWLVATRAKFVILAAFILEHKLRSYQAWVDTVFQFNNGLWNKTIVNWNLVIFPSWHGTP